MSTTNSAQFTIVFAALDRATATMRNINKSIGSIGTPLTDIGRKVTALAEETGLTKLGQRAVVVTEKFGHLGHQIAEIAGPLAALGAAGTAAGLFEMAKGAAEFGKQLYVAQQRTGMSADFLAKLHYAGSTVGLDDPAQIDKAMSRFNLTIFDAATGKNKDALAWFNAMHISIRNMNGSLKDAATLFPPVATRFANNPDLQQKDAAARAFFTNRLGPQMVPLLSMGGVEMNKLFANFERFYGKITPETMKSAREGAEAFETLKLAAGGLKFTIGNALLPVLSRVISPIAEWVAANRKLVAKNVTAWVTGIADALKHIDWKAVGSAFMGIAHTVEFVGRTLGPFWSTMAVAGAIFSPFLAGIGGAGLALFKLGKTALWVATKIGAFATIEGFSGLASNIGKLSAPFSGLMLRLATLTETILPSLSGAFLAVGAAIEATPIGWIITGIAAVAGAGYLLYEYWTPISSFFAGLWDDVKDVFIAAGKWIISVIPGGTLVQSIMMDWQALPQFFVTLWNDVKPAFTWLKNFAVGATDYAIEYLKARWAPVAGFFSALWSSTSAAFTWLKNFAIGAADFAVQGIKAVWQPVAAFFAGLWSGVTSGVQSAWQGIGSFFVGVWDGIKQVFVWGWNNIVPWIPGVILAKMVIDNWTPITHFFRSLWGGVTAIFETMWQKLKPIIETVVGGAKWLAEHTGLLDAYNVASKVTHVVVHEVVHTAARVGRGFEKIEERGEALSRMGNVARLANLVARGEGTYDAVNLGQRGGYRASTVPLGNMTLAQVMAAQKAHQFNAAGRYQIIGSTLIEAVKSLHLSTSGKFDATMQDRIFRQYLIGSRHPEIANFLSGRNNDVMAAARAASREWASIADPVTGRSHYAGVGNNKASIGVAEMVEALKAARVPSDAERAPVTSRPIVAARPGSNTVPQKSKTDVNIHVRSGSETTRVTTRSTGNNLPNVTVDRGRAWAQ